MNMNEVARRKLNEIILNFLENPKTQQQQKKTTNEKTPSKQTKKTPTKQKKN